METILQTTNLSRQFGKKMAVNNVNMTIHKGDIYGFIGKNGAGKTTFMRLVLGTAFPSKGEIKLFDGEPFDKARRKIGSLIEAPGLYKNCTAYENLKQFSLIYGGTDAEIKEILSLVGLADTGNKKAGKFSLGMRQRLGIAIALLGNPEFLVLDEPVNGLDPAGMKEVRDLILKLNHIKNITILISSHLLDELSKIVTRYGIINDMYNFFQFIIYIITFSTKDNLNCIGCPVQSLATFNFLNLCIIYFILILYFYTNTRKTAHDAYYIFFSPYILQNF